MRPVHPGEILRDELEQLKMSANQFARELHVPPNRISMLLIGKRSVTPDTALRLERVFGGTTAEFWLTLQAKHDIAIARRKLASELNAIRPLGVR